MLTRKEKQDIRLLVRDYYREYRRGGTPWGLGDIPSRAVGKAIPDSQRLWTVYHLAHQVANAALNTERNLSR